MTDTGEPALIVYLLGAGHCGSTLLGLLLGGHPDIVYLGELVRLGRGRESTLPHGADVTTPFWGGVAARLQSGGRALEDVVAANPTWRQAQALSGTALQAAVADDRAVIDAAAAEAGARIAVDASKGHQRADLLIRGVPGGVRVIHLERDGRAVYASYRRKGWRRHAALRRWAAPTVAAAILRRRVPAGGWMNLRYEDLVAAPEEVLARLWRFLAVAPPPAPIDLAAVEDVSLGGNRMRGRRQEGLRPHPSGWPPDTSELDRVAFTVSGAGLLNLARGYR